MTVVAPALGLCTVAFVLGYETHRRPPTLRPAWLDWPLKSERQAETRDRVSAVGNTAAILGAAVALRVATGGDRLVEPASAWFLLAIVAAVFVVMSPTQTPSALRRGLWSLLAVALAWLVTTWAEVDFTELAGAVIGAFCGPRCPLRAILCGAALCVVAAFAAGPLGAGLVLCGGAVAAGAPTLHRSALFLAQAITDSWSAVRIGPVRIINYAAYAMLGAMVGAAVFLRFVPHFAGPAVLITASALVGGALWGAGLESTGRLTRPFGYFGAMLGAGAGVWASHAWLGAPVLELAAAGALAAPWVQAIGRLRCLVQGCCHGRPVSHADAGLLHNHPQSRVMRLSNLRGRALHPTPLYSIYGNLLLGAVLLRLQQAEQPAPLLVGIYLIGAGAFRFMEEAFRGEPQTPVVLDLRLYQWLGLFEVVLGALITMVRGRPLASATSLSASSWVAVVACGLMAAAAMGVDLPASGRRFSRLTPI